MIMMTQSTHGETALTKRLFSLPSLPSMMIVMMMMVVIVMMMATMMILTSSPEAKVVLLAKLAKYDDDDDGGDDDTEDMYFGLGFSHRFTSPILLYMVRKVTGIDYSCSDIPRTPKG